MPILSFSPFAIENFLSTAFQSSANQNKAEVVESSNDSILSVICQNLFKESLASLMNYLFLSSSASENSVEKYLETIKSVFDFLLRNQNNNSIMNMKKNIFISREFIDFLWIFVSTPKSELQNKLCFFALQEFATKISSMLLSSAAACLTTTHSTWILIHLEAMSKKKSIINKNKRQTPPPRRHGPCPTR